MYCFLFTIIIGWTASKKINYGGKKVKNLFESHTINNKIIKNRIAIPAMCIAIYREDGYVSDEVIEHYRSLAKGGAGLIVQEATCISPTGRLMKTQLGIWEDGQIEGLHKITDAVHNEGGTILAQIHHAGVLTVDSIIDSPSDFETVLYNGQKILLMKCHLKELNI